MTKRDRYVDPRPWIVVLNDDDRAESMWDAGQPGLRILPGARYWREKDANAHRDSYNRAADERAARDLDAQMELQA